MVTAFVDMVGLLMVIPLLPFYAVRMGGGGLVVGVLVSSYAVAQLLSAPLWGRVSDRFGRRPALLVGLGASAVAYVIFAYADSLWVLLLSRLVQGAGGGTVGVIQAYVADATEPENRARSLGWLSAATNVGVTIGPVIGSLSMGIGAQAPGLLAAGLCVANMAFAWFYLQESHDVAGARSSTRRPVRPREAVWQVLSHPGEPAPRMIWIYSIGMGAFQMMTALLALFLATRFGVTEKTIGVVYAYNGAISVLARAVFLGRAVDRLGEARLSRVGQLLLASGLALLPLTWRIEGAASLDLSALPWGWGVVEVPLRTLALMGALALVPLGTAFTFPCVTSILSRVIPPYERGVYMGVQQSFGGAARVLAPLWAGWAFDHLGVGVPFWSGSVLVLATLLLGFGIEEYTRPRPEPAALETA
ncbi:MAG TPA: MFS transporter [Longimicrobiaceae bacterium]|nr:MFS transporter [Longimicrobiaceae bacterium]